MRLVTVPEAISAVTVLATDSSPTVIDTAPATATIDTENAPETVAENEVILAAETASTLTRPAAVTAGSRVLPSAVPMRAVTRFVTLSLAITRPGATPTLEEYPNATARLPAPASDVTVGVSAARTSRVPVASDPAVTVDERISAVVVVASVVLTKAPDPATETPVDPPTATLIATPNPSEATLCFDSARSETSPRAATVDESMADRTEFVTSTTLRAAPTVTPTAADFPSVTPSPTPPALASTFDSSVATMLTAPSVLTALEPEMAASRSTARRFVLPAPAPERPTAAPSPLATCPVPAIVQDVIEGFALALTVRSPPSSVTFASSTTALTLPRDVAVPISLFATDMPAASDTVFPENWAASAPATAKMSPESSAVTESDFDVTVAFPRTAAVSRRTTVLSANDPAPTNETGSEPSMPPPELPDSAPLTPTAQASTLPSASVATVTSPPRHVTVACSIAAVTSTSTLFTAPAAPAETAADFEAGIATWPATARRFVSSRAETVTPRLADTVERRASVPVTRAETDRPERSLNTSAVESAFWPDITPLAAIVSRSGRSAAMTMTRPEVSTTGSVPAVTLEETIDAFVSPPSEVTSTAAPAESAERSPERAVVASDPATVRIFASSIAVTSTEPAVAVTAESSAIVAVS